MSLFQYAGLRFNFNCWLSGFNTLASSLIFFQAVQTLGSIADDPLIILNFTLFSGWSKFGYHRWSIFG